MVKYRDTNGREIRRSTPDHRLEASDRWERVEPLSRVPAPEREPADDYSVAFGYDDDGDEPSERKE